MNLKLFKIIQILLMYHGPTCPHPSLAVIGAHKSAVDCASSPAFFRINSPVRAEKKICAARLQNTSSTARPKFLPRGNQLNPMLSDVCSLAVRNIEFSSWVTWQPCAALPLAVSCQRERREWRQRSSRSKRRCGRSCCCQRSSTW
jgi:hypothetical protein